jgi:hypothetical protein
MVSAMAGDGDLLPLFHRVEQLTVRPARSREAARAAVRRIRERAEQSKLGRFDWPEWKSYRDEGRP